MMQHFVPNSSLQKQKKSQRKTMLCMRQNLQQLNRSMQSIEKMIERSRKILNHSKQKNKTLNDETYRNDSQQYQQYQTLVNNHPQQPRITPINQKHNKEFSFQTRPEQFFILDKENQKKQQKNKVNSSRGKATLTQSVKTNVMKPNNYKASPRNTEIKFKRIVQNEINQRFSSSKQKGFQSQLKKSKEKYSNNYASKATKPPVVKPQQLSDKSKQKFREEIKDSYSPFRQKIQKDKKIYKFSPQKTGTIKKVPLIKLDLKGLNNLTPEKRTYETYNNGVKLQTLKTAKTEEILIQSSDNIRIQEDDYLFNSDKGWKDFQNQISFHAKEKPFIINESRQKEIRYKTQYRQQDETYKIEQPKVKLTLKKINLKKAVNSDSKKDMLISQRQVKAALENTNFSARLTFTKDKDNKQKQMSNLIKQLDQLQTVSVDEDDRKNKFMMKIKRYGFVQKYLKEQQIWSIYNQLIDANVNQLKWPIFIVDEVYRRMKISHTL